MEEYEFTATWTHKSSPPPSGTRCIVTDGDTIVVGTYAQESVWILTGVQPPYDVIGWMPVPKPMKKIVAYVETPVEKDKRTD